MCGGGNRVWSGRGWGARVDTDTTHTRTPPIYTRTPPTVVKSFSERTTLLLTLGGPTWVALVAWWYFADKLRWQDQQRRAGIRAPPQDTLPLLPSAAWATAFALLIFGRWVAGAPIFTPLLFAAAFFFFFITGVGIVLVLHRSTLLRWRHVHVRRPAGVSLSHESETNM